MNILYYLVGHRKSQVSHGWSHSCDQSYSEWALPYIENHGDWNQPKLSFSSALIHFLQFQYRHQHFQLAGNMKLQTQRRERRRRRKSSRTWRPKKHNPITVTVMIPALRSLRDLDNVLSNWTRRENANFKFIVMNLPVEPHASVLSHNLRTE